ncbi:hypothetical protein IF1G_04107 [Cordyceps javanica]|uniref:Uncharacterized protein n=1 Tax=Cordyceps javanica TaxID=43265 RepID=A0A545V572_9HYPO|nr:hypothetical protein IF1G_04107 [Cordyceps javanica]
MDGGKEARVRMPWLHMREGQGQVVLATQACAMDQIRGRPTQHLYYNCASVWSEKTFIGTTEAIVYHAVMSTMKLSSDSTLPTRPLISQDKTVARPSLISYPCNLASTHVRFCNDESNEPTASNAFTFSLRPAPMHAQP